MQDKCSYCRRRMGKHEDHCPLVQDNVQAAIAVYEEGYRARRRGEKMDPQKALNRTYGLGFGNGSAALEEAENGSI